MNDRELLELAAKAAGIEHYGEYNASGGLKTTGGWWNPIDGDSAAFQLAVKLGLLVYVLREIGFTAIRLPDENIGGQFDVTEHHGRDPYAATRRAIVRAAAEVGKGIIQLRSEIDLPEDNYYKTMAEAEEIGRNQS